MANQGNGGIRGKFQERLRNIRLSRIRKRKFQEENQEFIEKKIEEIRIVVGQEPIRTRGVRAVGKSSENKNKNKVVLLDKHQEKQFMVPEKSVGKIVKDIHDTTSDRSYGSKKVGYVLEKDNNLVQKQNVDLSDKDNVQEIRENKPNLSHKRKGYSYKQVNDFKEKISASNFNDDERKEELENLGSQIIERIKNSFEDSLDQLEILMSELYFLEKNQENELELKKVKEIKKEIHELIEKVNHLIEQYNLYKRNYYLDNLVGIDDNELVDDIIRYRGLLDSANDEKKFVREFKALDEFQSLYQNLKSVRENTISLCEANEEKIKEFDVRDKKYRQIQADMVQVNNVMKNCDEEIKRQDEYFVKLMSKINKINSEEYTTYHLRGVQDLISQSLRYVGLLMLSPLSGLLPGISVQTMATRRMIEHVYRQMHTEEVHHIRYSTIDYDRELSSKITDINFTSNLLDDTIQDIERLRDDFLIQYNSKIPGYEDTLRKINQIHHQVLRSQNRVEKIRDRLKKSKKLNEQKLIRVKELNKN